MFSECKRYFIESRFSTEFRKATVFALLDDKPFVRLIDWGFCQIFVTHEFLRKKAEIFEFLGTSVFANFQVNFCFQHLLVFSIVRTNIVKTFFTVIRFYCVPKFEVLEGKWHVVCNEIDFFFNFWLKLVVFSVSRLPRLMKGVPPLKLSNVRSLWCLSVRFCVCGLCK